MTVAVLALVPGIAIAVDIDQQGLSRELAGEAQVKDVAFTEAGNLYVGVVDDGSSRDGYAQYLCEVVKDYATGDGRVLIKIIDVAAAARDEGLKELGSHWCRT